MKPDADYWKGFWTGRAIGVRLAALGILPKWYLYNGVRLPKLPDWDKTKYPYAVITYRESIECYHFSVYERIHYWTQSIGSIFKYSYFGSENGDPAALVWTHYATETDWTRLDRTTWSFGVDIDRSISDKALWANFDLLYSDDSLYVTASEPIPVYE